MTTDYTPEFEVGDMVTLICNRKDTAVVPDMLKFHGYTTRITKIHKTKRLGGMQTNVGRTYECEGVESPYGIPYLFTKDMLIPEVEEDDE